MRQSYNKDFCNNREGAPDFDEIEEKTEAVFIVSRVEYIGSDISYIGNIESLDESLEPIKSITLLTCNKYLDHTVAFFNKQKGTKSGELSSIFSQFAGEKMKIISTNNQFVFFIEKIKQGNLSYIKVIQEV